jgi:hypothetical protein
VQIVLHDAVTVRGTLRNRAGAPVADAVVEATPMATDRLWLAKVRARSDAEGRFELEGVPLGQTWFLAGVPGEGFARLAEVVTNDSEIELRIADEPTAVLRITVEGMPAAELGSMRFQVQSENLFLDLPGPGERLDFDANGVCELARLPESSCLVSPEAAGWEFTPAHDLVIPKEGRTGARFMAKRVDASGVHAKRPANRAGLQGRALQSDGHPAALATTYLECPGTDVGSWWVVFEGRTRRDGSFTLHLPDASDVWFDDKADAWRVRIVSPDGTRESASYPPDRLDPLFDLGDLVLDPAAVIEGVVRKEDGSPAAGVSVTRQRWDAATGKSVFEMSDLVVVTDRLGRYRFVGVPAGGAEVFVGGARILNLEQLFEVAAPQPDPMTVEAGRTYTVDLELPAR